MIFAASFNFGKMLLLDTITGNVLAVLSDRRRTMRAVPNAAPGALMIAESRRLSCSWRPAVHRMQTMRKIQPPHYLSEPCCKKIRPYNVVQVCLSA